MTSYENVLSVCSDAGYIIDFRRRCFRCVSNHDLFLCGHSQEDAMRLGYDFYPHIVHKDDLRLLAKMHCAILKSPYISEYQENIAHFSFIVRIKVYPDIAEQAEYQTIYHRLKPVFFSRQLCFGICMMNISALRTSGHLRVYFKDNRHSFDEYSLVSRRWHTKPVEDLTNREMLILKLSKQGVNGKEIADRLQLKYETLRNINTSIHRKLGVETVQQAIVYATNHLMLFDARRTSDTAEKGKGKKHCRDPKLKLIPEKLEYIQECLNNGQSIRSIARDVGVSDCCIRNAIEGGRLHKKTTVKS